ncbi:MAG: spermidine synthase [Sulfuricurvum sp.]|nr:spermidine synthase [Sulfuricurvum sp.]
MKTFIYPEMMVHIPMCTHKNPASVVVASEDNTLLIEELGRYRDLQTTFMGSENLLEPLRNVADKSVDIAMIDAVQSDGAVLAHLNRILKEDGLAVMRHPDLEDIQSNSNLMGVLGNYFKIIMPYHLEDGSTLLLCSKEYHPTADLILQRSDLLEGHQYYNCDIHTASFAMPQYIRKNYLGIIRN